MADYDVKLLGEDVLQMVAEQSLFARFLRRDIVDEPFLALGKEVLLNRPIHPEGRLYPGHGPFYPQSLSSYSAVLERHPYVYLPVHRFLEKPLVRLQEEVLQPISEIFANNIEDYLVSKIKEIPNIYPDSAHTSMGVETVQGMRAFEGCLENFTKKEDVVYTGVVAEELAETLAAYALQNEDTEEEDDYIGSLMGVDWYYGDSFDRRPVYHTTGTAMYGEINGERLGKASVLPLKNISPASGTFVKFDTLVIPGVGNVVVADDVVASRGYADVPVFSSVPTLSDGTRVRLYGGGAQTYQVLGIVFSPSVMTFVSAMLDTERIQTTNFLAEQIDYFSDRGFGIRFALQRDYQHATTAVLFADMLFGGSVGNPSAGMRILKAVS